MSDLSQQSAQELREQVIVVGGGNRALEAFEELVRRAAALEAAEMDRAQADAQAFIHQGRSEAAEARVAELETALRQIAKGQPMRGAAYIARAALAVSPRHQQGDEMSIEVPTGDDPVLCHLCGKDTSIAMIVHHLVTEHGIDPEDIANAPVIVEDSASKETE